MPAEQLDHSWLVLAYPGNPSIRLDCRILDRIMVDDDMLIMSINEYGISLKVSGGSEIARYLAERLAPVTRSAPITSPEILEYTKQCLSFQRDPALFYGESPVRSSGKIIYVGNRKYWISDVIEYADRNLAFPLPDGRIQAGLLMITIADMSRSRDVSLLTSRIADYEARQRRER